jgi:hypothetical protein
MKFGNENVAKSFAFDDKDEFFKKPWYVHAGTWGAGFANGAWVGAFDANKWDLFDGAEIRNEFLRAGIELWVRGLGFTGEFLGTAYAKSEYGKKPMKLDTYFKKMRNSSPKNLGYILITYFK